MTRFDRKGILTSALGLALVATAFGPASAGELRRPTAAENKSLVAGLQAMKSAIAPLPLKRFADGTMAIDLGTAFLNISVVRMQPDGSAREVCVDDPGSIDALLTAAPASEEK